MWYTCPFVCVYLDKSGRGFDRGHIGLTSYNTRTIPVFINPDDKALSMPTTTDNLPTAEKSSRTQSANESQINDFQQLALAQPILKAIEEVGYETPSPIQAAAIPHLLNGEDILGQAQTGTGKTAAFALPLLSNIDIRDLKPQILVLAPTRELAIQVAEAFQTYARYLKGFHVAPIYGGQSMNTQLRQLKRGVHVVIGTPGRIMDHLRRGSLVLDSLKSLVLDEAAEMEDSPLDPDEIQANPHVLHRLRGEDQPEQRR